MFGNIGEMMKQAKNMQAKIAEAEAKLATLTVEGGAGNGLIKITASGKGTIETLKIDPSLADPQEIEVLEDLLLAALHDVQTRANDLEAEEMGKVTGGMKLPKGMKLPF